MGRPSKGRLRLVLVAALTLVAAVAGTAVAGSDQGATTSLSKKKTKKLAKKLDKKQDKKNFPVETDQIADNAVTGSKVDESSLSEVPTAAFATGNNIRSAFSNGANINITGNGGNQTVQTVDITAPVSGQLLINGGLHPDNGTGDDIYSCDVLLDGSQIGASSRGSVMTNDVGANDNNSCETSAGSAVSSGSHTVALRSLGIPATSEIEDASLQVLFIPNP